MKIEYAVEMTIDRPRDTVVALFDDPENLKQWLHGLESLEPIEGEPGAVGSKSRLVFKDKGRTMEMVETILERSPPHRFRFSYACGKVWNEVDNTFEECGDGGQTRWIGRNVFVLGGWMKLLGIFMRGAFPKQSREHMERFKAFVEAASEA